MLTLCQALFQALGTCYSFSITTTLWGGNYYFSYCKDRVLKHRKVKWLAQGHRLAGPKLEGPLCLLRLSSKPDTILHSISKCKRCYCITTLPLTAFPNPGCSMWPNGIEQCDTLGTHQAAYPIQFQAPGLSTKHIPSAEYKNNQFFHKYENTASLLTSTAQQPSLGDEILSNTVAPSYYTPEMWLVQLRNWLFNFISLEFI